MKIERKSRGTDEGDVFYVEPGHSGSLTAAATLGAVKYTAPEHFGLVFALQAAKGQVALTQDQLRDSLYYKMARPLSV